MQLDKLDAAAIAYINELKATHELQLQLMQTQHEQQYKSLQNEYDCLKEKYELLVYKRFARSAERLLADSKQQLLFSEGSGEPGPEGKEEEPELQTVRPHVRKKAGRKPLDASLPRTETLLDISESEKICACGAKMVRIGEETSEKLHITPPEIRVEVTVRPKYACRCCEGTEDEEKPAVRIAPVEPSIIPRSIASPSLLSTVVTQKFEMHLPYYRQEKQFEQIGARISRQDMSNWQQQLYIALLPLLALLQTIVKSGPTMNMDETTVQVIGEEGRLDTQKSHMWLARGGPPGKTVLWYEYHPTRAAYHAKEFLQGYAGYLQTDGYNGYDAAVKDMPGIIQVGCFAHARRKFFEAAKASKKSQSAEEGVKYIRRLYDLENSLRGEDLEENDFLEKRKAGAAPILAKFLEWLKNREAELLPSSLLGGAVSYALNQWGKLVAYLESPYLTPDNNAAENAIRPFVLGRKNWLFSQSPRGAASSCAMYSLIETAKQNGLVPFKYLVAVFEKAPLAESPEDWERLLPWNIFEKK